MTSIFDQYEQASQASQQRSKPTPDLMTSSGYVSMQLEDNSPMFSKQKMNFSPSDLITHVAIASDYLTLAMANGKLFRMDLKNPDHHEEIHVARPNLKLSEIFLDPLGYHLLMSFVPRTKDGNPELVYVNRKSTKVKTLNKSRNYEVTEVGWNNENNSESTTGPMLVGTSQGHLLEMEFEANSDKMFSAGQQSWRQLPNYLPLYGGKEIEGLVFDISKGAGSETPITGIQFHRVDSSSKYFVFVTTPKRLYQFIGHATLNDDKPSLQSIFHSYLTRPETDFQEIPSSLKYSKLQFCFDKQNVPKTFAWLTEQGIFYGQLDPTSQQNSNTLYTQGELINYPENTDDGKPDKTPLAFVLTEFHALLMFPNKIKVISLLNQELVHEDHYSEAHGRLKNIIKDTRRRSLWAVTDKLIFRYKVVREDRNVWRIYTEKQQFDLAKLHCQNNPAFIDFINVKQAEMLFSKKEYERSAEIFAETQSSFETVCLKFLEIEETDALKVYLNRRLESLSDDDNTLIPMLVLWMTELYVSQMSLLRRTGQGDSQKYHETQSDFEVFLLQPKVSKCIQHIKPAIYDVLSSHGDKQNLMKLTLFNEDYENVIAQYIYSKSYVEALATLKNLKKPELFYHFTPELIQATPKNTVNTLISQGARLNPAKLLPAFLSCVNDSEHKDEIIRYLDFMLKNFNVKDKAVHNYLITLYADHDPELLMTYLSRQGQELALVNYDVHYALRLCREKNLPVACVKLSALLGLWEAAVEQALDVDLALAKSLSSMPDEEPDLQKKLWLMIAEHVISKKQDLKEAIAFLEESHLLKIEDILPFFSDVVTIDHFREPICQSLQEYNNQIEELKAEMEEATKSAEYVRSEIASLRSYSVMVSASDSCSLCDIALLLRPFYLFPCTHKFHADCLMGHVEPYLSPARRMKLSELQRRLSGTTVAGGARDSLRAEIDDIIAADCALCGEQVINDIDKPLVSDDEDGRPTDWD